MAKRKITVKYYKLVTDTRVTESKLPDHVIAQRYKMHLNKLNNEQSKDGPARHILQEISFEEVPDDYPLIETSEDMGQQVGDLNE